MGIIRKTASVGTLGIVNFRSKKERLRRTERKLAKVETQLRELKATPTDEKLGRRARRAAERASHEMKRGAERAVHEAREVLTPS